MEPLKILTWEEVWNDVGRQYPTLAGTAYLMWATWGMRVGSCLFYAVGGRHKDYWAKRHQTLSYQYTVVDGHICRTKILEDAEHAAKVLEELEREFAGDERVMRVIALLMDGKTQTEIAEQFGVTRQAIHKQLEKIRNSKCVGAFEENV